MLRGWRWWQVRVVVVVCGVRVLQMWGRRVRCGRREGTTWAASGHVRHERDRDRNGQLRWVKRRRASSSATRR